ncbi:MerR family transcriptional regulator, partial [Streptosporangium algeriense]
SELGWRTEPWAPALDELAQALYALDRLGMPMDDEALRPYARAAETLVEHEFGVLPLDGPRETAVETLVIGTVMHGRVLDVLRRLAHESASARFFGIEPGGDGDKAHTAP